MFIFSFCVFLWNIIQRARPKKQNIKELLVVEIEHFEKIKNNLHLFIQNLYIWCKCFQHERNNHLHLFVKNYGKFYYENFILKNFILISKKTMESLWKYDIMLLCQNKHSYEFLCISIPSYSFIWITFFTAQCKKSCVQWKKLLQWKKLCRASHIRPIWLYIRPSGAPRPPCIITKVGVCW